MAPFVRKVDNGGGTAVQIVEEVGRLDRVVEHVGTAHDEAELAALVSAARERLHPAQGVLDVFAAGSWAPPELHSWGVSRGEVVEDGFRGWWVGGFGGDVVSGDADGDVTQGPELPDDAFRGRSSAALNVPGNCEGGHDDSQVRVDGLVGVVEDRPGFEVGCAHAEGLLRMPEIVVRGDHLSGGHQLFGDLGDVALQSHEHSRPLNILLVDAR